MNKLSLFAIILGVIGVLSFILSGVASIQKGMEDFTTLQLTFFYVFCATGILCFIISFTLGVLGFKKSEGNKILKYVGLFFVPIIVITSVSFGLLIAWTAFA